MSASCIRLQIPGLSPPWMPVEGVTCRARPACLCGGAERIMPHSHWPHSSEGSGWLLPGLELVSPENICPCFALSPMPESCQRAGRRQGSLGMFPNHAFLKGKVIFITFNLEKGVMGTSSGAHFRAAVQHYWGERWVTRVPCFMPDNPKNRHNGVSPDRQSSWNREAFFQIPQA